MPQVALTIIHQHAIQGDVTDLQLALVRWMAYSKISQEKFLDPKVLYKLLQDMDQVGCGSRTIQTIIKLSLFERLLMSSLLCIGLVHRNIVKGRGREFGRKFQFIRRIFFEPN